MKTFFLLFLLTSVRLVQAHEPDLSNLMVYEQNGKHFLTVRSSLLAFEGEIHYLFGKNSYKTPEAFESLVIRHFQNNCFLIANGDTIRLMNPKVFLGHETTVIAELSNPPKIFNSIYVRNDLFKDMPNNMSELIIAINGLPLKQYILNNSNNHEIGFKVEKGNWEVANKSYSFYKKPILISFLILSFIIGAAKMKTKKGMFLKE
jgi:hypothetical protein